MLCSKNVATAALRRRSAALALLPTSYVHIVRVCGGGGGGAWPIHSSDEKEPNNQQRYENEEVKHHLLPSAALVQMGNN